MVSQSLQRLDIHTVRFCFMPARATLIPHPRAPAVATNDMSARTHPVNDDNRLRNVEAFVGSEHMITSHLIKSFTVLLLHNPFCVTKLSIETRSDAPSSANAN